MRWAEWWPALVDLRLSIALFNGRIPEASGALVDYDKRLASGQPINAQRRQHGRPPREPAASTC